MTAILTTKRLRLRSPHADDAFWIARNIADPDIHRWLISVPRPYSLEDADAFIANVADQPGYRVIEEHDTPVGVLSIQSRPDRDPVHTLGYWLIKSAWGRGLMSEAATAAVNAHFAATADPLGSSWVEGNAVSENVLMKLGFERTGQTIPTHSHFHAAKVPLIHVCLTQDRWATLERSRQSR